MQQIEQLARWLSEAERGVVFTGAGMSTESGIADFRSPGGIWSRFTPVYYDDFVRDRSERVRYWKMRTEMLAEFGAAKPNPGHHATARLEALGRVVAVVTQNIDGLHQLAGSRRVIEIHGNSRKAGCIGCGREWPTVEILALVAGGDEAPDCPDCGRPIKCREISFGQAMPDREMREAAQLAMDADLYLAIGSSLAVEPAASLPAIAKRGGARLVIINYGDTPLDGHADLLIRGGIGETLSAALSLVEPRSAWPEPPSGS